MNRIYSELHGKFETKAGIEGSSYRMGKQGLKLAFVEQRLVDAFIGEISKPSEEAKRLMDKVFGKRIKTWTEGNQAVGESLIHSIYSQCLDDGVSIEHSYTDVNGKKHTEPGHSILNRKAMLTELKTRVGFNFNKEKQNYEVAKNFKILPLDLKNFREADLQGAGDYDLNIFTRQLNKAMETIAKDLHVSPDDLVLGRYGGDEFYVAIIENKNQGKVNSFDKAAEIKNIIIETAQSADGFFGENKPTKFTIQDVDKVDYITINNMDPVSRMIYLNFLNDDLVLGTIELQGERTFVEESIKKMKKNKLTILEFLSHNNRNPYPEDVTKEKDPKTLIHNKIRYLIKGHDALNLPYVLAEDLDAKDGGKRIAQLLDFYQNYLIDPLLNEITMSRSDIFSHIKRGEFSNIYAFEVKMKEINDNMSYVYGDKTINKLWQDKFKGPLRDLIESGKVKVGRIGGMLVVCEANKGERLSDEQRKLLDDPLQIESEFKGQKVNHEIGYAKIEVPKDINQNDESFRKVVEDMFNKPTENWLIKTFKRIINDEAEFDEFINTLKNKESNPNNIITMVSARYFDSIKRAAKRIPIAHEILKELRKDNIDRVEEIYTLLTLIKDGFGWVLTDQQPKV